MLALAAVGFALVVGVLSGGNLRGLASAKLHGETWILLLFVVQALARGPIISRYAIAGLVIWGSTSLMLLLLMIVQAERPGMGIALSGIAANALVVLSNGGMPAGGSTYSESPALTESIASHAGFYQPITSATHLGWLGDVIPAAGGLASLGDLLLVVGVAVFLLDLMLQPAVVE